MLRTRLTHSLEVAEVASRIANRQNELQNLDGKPERKLDVSIVAAAALAHDLGHPPFGHTGEKALHQIMKNFGGFEGNAQTLRIITKLENRITRSYPSAITRGEMMEEQYGLNLTYRSIAALLKYDSPISSYETGERIKKGFYETERPIVDQVRDRLLGSNKKALNTIECQIMDLADDIAYSIYDLEDCMIAAVATPADLLSQTEAELKKIAEAASKHLCKYGYEENALNAEDVQVVFFDLFSTLIQMSSKSSYDMNSELSMATYFIGTYNENKIASRDHLYRRRITEIFIHEAIESISIEWDQDTPALSKIDISTRYRLYIECLKAFNYENVINSQRLRVNAYKGVDTINILFTALMADKDGKLVNDNFTQQYRLNEVLDATDNPKFAKYEHEVISDELIGTDLVPFESARGMTYGEVRRRMRFVCDYIASMTDEEAVEMCGRLKAPHKSTVFGVQI